MTATGASVAETTQPVQPLAFTVEQQDIARTQEAVTEESVTEIASRRADASLQSAALQGRTEAKIRAAEEDKVPLALIVGDREAEARSISIRRRGGASAACALDALAERLGAELSATS